MSPKELTDELKLIHPMLDMEVNNAPGECDSFDFYFDERHICKYVESLDEERRSTTVDLNVNIGIAEFDEWFFDFLKLLEKYTELKEHEND